MSEINKIRCEDDKKFYPEIIEENVQTHKLDAETRTYLPLLTVKYSEEERGVVKQAIVRFGRKWQEFMQKNYPFEIAPLEMREQYGLVARKVEKKRWRCTGY